MALRVLVEGGGGTTSEALQEQALLVGAPLVAVAFAEQAPLAMQVQGGGVAVAVLAPGYSEQMIGAQRLNDLLDVGNEILNVLQRAFGFLGELADFLCHHVESPAVNARAGGHNGGID